MFGLFHPDFSKGYLVHQNNVNLIHAKKVICIWCHASDFCKAHNLKCLCSSMFITNVGEAYYLGMRSTQEHINTTVKAFYKELNECVRDKRTLAETYEYLAEHIDTENEIDNYNRNGVMLND